MSVQNVKIFGDSHTVYFKQLSMRARYLSYLFDDYSFLVDVYQGASIKGFGNRNSTLNSLDKLTSQLESNDIVVLNFGQVDIELGIYFKRIVKGEEITNKAFISQCLSAYEALISEIKKITNKVIIKGINSPVLIDNAKSANYVHRIITENINDEVEVTLAKKRLTEKMGDVFERIGLMRAFNQKLKALAESKGCIYFDIIDDTCHPTGIVKEEFIPASFDHHLVDSLLVRIIHQKRLKEALVNL